MNKSEYMRLNISVFGAYTSPVCSIDIIEREQNVKIYRIITRKIPTFETRIPVFIENPEQLNDLSIAVRL